MDVEQVKKELLKTMASIDKEKLSLTELRLYAEILKTVSETQGKSYADLISETMHRFNTASVPKAPTVADMK